MFRHLLLKLSALILCPSQKTPELKSLCGCQARNEAGTEVTSKPSPKLLLVNRPTVLTLPKQSIKIHQMCQLSQTMTTLGRMLCFDLNTNFAGVFR